MTGQNGNPDKKNPMDDSGNLESWLQLPDSYNGEAEADQETSTESTSVLDEIEEVTDDKPDTDDRPMLDELPEDPECVLSETDTDPDEKSESKPVEEASQDPTPVEPEPLSLFNGLPIDTVPPPDEELEEPPAIPEESDESGDPDTEEPETTRDESEEYEHHLEIPPVVDPDPESDEEDSEDDSDEEPEDHVLSLENKLGHEYRDTLTGPNANTLPLGIFFLLLSLLGFFHLPIADLLNLSSDVEPVKVWIFASSGLLAIISIHLLIYWVFHLVSNAVKSRELDNLIEIRRFSAPCAYLDCDEPDDLDDLTDEAGMAWKCNNFEITLEGSLICAVCDKYESNTTNDGVQVETE